MEGSLEIKVINSFGQPLEKTQITIDGLVQRTDESGLAIFDRIGLTQKTITTSKDNYITKKEEYDLLQYKTSPLIITLASSNDYLVLSEFEAFVEITGSSITIDVKSNTEWEIQNIPDWINSSVVESSGNQSVTLSISENVGDEQRSAKIIFKTLEVQRQFEVLQDVEMKLIYSKANFGNELTKTSNSVEVRFSKPVSVLQIISQHSRCKPNIGYSLSDAKRVLTFEISCAELGDNYPFEITVEDDKGTKLTSQLDFTFYQYKQTIQGWVQNIESINDDRELIICARNPSMIYRYSIESNEVLQAYDFSGYISPIKISYNPYNRLIYVLGNSNPNFPDLFAGINSTKVFTLNIDSGEIQEVLDTKKMEFHNTKQSATYAIGDIQFGNNGKGIIILNGLNSSGESWELIDSSNDHQLIRFEFENNPLISSSLPLEKPTINYDQTKIYLIRRYQSLDYYELDTKSLTFKSFRSKQGSGAISITLNKYDNRIFFRQLYHQYIGDFNGNSSKVSYLDSRHGGESDFSYRNGEESIVYICEAKSFLGSPNFFRIMDYQKGETIRQIHAVDGLQEYFNTKNGQSGIAYEIDGLTSNIVVFDLSRF